MDKKRYFIVFYIGGVGTLTVTGQMNFIVYGGYLERSEVIKQICETTEGLEDAVLTNIIELSEADYNDWIKPLPLTT